MEKKRFTPITDMSMSGVLLQPCSAELLHIEKCHHLQLRPGSAAPAGCLGGTPPELSNGQGPEGYWERPEG